LNLGFSFASLERRKLSILRMKSNIVELRYIKHLVAKSLVLMASLATIAPNPANSAPPPTQVGKCADTFIQRISTRLGGSLTETQIEGLGSSVKLTNGIYLVSYDNIKQLRVARPQDKVKVCLIEIPENCPPGDNRGRVYGLLNYRTNGYIEMPDSQHRCGGA
jgi:hypothetical protein